jgi:hypothetical protein
LAGCSGTYPRHGTRIRFVVWPGHRGKSPRHDARLPSVCASSSTGSKNRYLWKHRAWTHSIRSESPERRLYTGRSLIFLGAYFPYAYTSPALSIVNMATPVMHPNENQGPTILGATWTVTIAALLTTIARLYVRVGVIRNVGWDVSTPRLPQWTYH